MKRERAQIYTSVEVQFIQDLYKNGWVQLPATVQEIKARLGVRERRK